MRTTRYERNSAATVTMAVLMASVCLLLAGSASAGVTVSNQTITSATSFSNYDYVTISNCTFTNCSATSGGALLFYNVAQVTVEDCTFTNITGGLDDRGAIAARKCADIDIIDTTIDGVSGGNGLAFPYGNPAAGEQNGNITIQGCEIYNCGRALYAFYVDGTLEILDNTIGSEDEGKHILSHGIELGKQGSAVGYVNDLLIDGNTFTYIYGDGINAKENVYSATVTNNEISYIAYDGTGVRGLYTGDHGMYWQGPDALISGNYIHDCMAQGGSLGISMRVQGTITGNIVHDCVSEGIGYYSDHVASGTLEISNNLIYDVGAHGIWLRGALGGDLNQHRYEVDVFNIFNNTIYQTSSASPPVGSELLFQSHYIYVYGNILIYADKASPQYFDWVGPCTSSFFCPIHFAFESPGGEHIYTSQNTEESVLANIDDMFADYANRDFHLKYGCAAIDAAPINNDTITTDIGSIINEDDDIEADPDGDSRYGDNDAGCYEYVSGPGLSSIQPSAGPTAGGTAATLSGQDLTGATAVKFGGTSATNVSVVSANEVRCTSPAKSAGTYSVVATVDGEDTNGVDFTYVAAPTLSSISPTTGPAGGATPVTLTGTNFISGATVSFGGNAATGVVVDSTTQIRCTSPAGSGSVNVSVTTGGGTSGNQTYVYIAAPTLSAISPTSGAAAGGTAVTLTGTNLTGCSAVSFGANAATGISVVSSTQVRCTSPAGSGSPNVTATTPGGTSNAMTYTYTGAVYTQTLYTTADTWVQTPSSGYNFGTQSVVKIQHGNTTHKYIFLKYDLSSITGSTVTSAKLQLYYLSGVALSVSAYSCSTDSWGETTITWGNMPALGTLQTTTAVGAAVAYYTWDITSYIASERGGDQTATVILLDDLVENINAAFNSKEAGSNKPILVVISQ